MRRPEAHQQGLVLRDGRLQLGDQGAFRPGGNRAEGNIGIPQLRAACRSPVGRIVQQSAIRESVRGGKRLGTGGILQGRPIGQPGANGFGIGRVDPAVPAVETELSDLLQFPFGLRLGIDIAQIARPDLRRE